MGQIDEQERKWRNWGVGYAFAILAVVIILLVSFIWSGLSARSSEELRLQIGTLSNVKQLATALRLYAADNDDRFPADFSTHEELRAAVSSYVRSESVFETRNPRGGEILPNAELAGIKRSAVVDPAETVLIFETKDWPDGEVVIAAVDTSAKFVDSRDLLNFDPGTIESETID